MEAAEELWFKADDQQRKEEKRKNTVPTMFSSWLDSAGGKFLSGEKKEEVEVGDGKRWALKAKHVITLTLRIRLSRRTPLLAP